MAPPSWSLLSSSKSSTLHLTLTSSAWAAPQLKDMEAIIEAGQGTHGLSRVQSLKREQKTIFEYECLVIADEEISAYVFKEVAIL